MFGGFYGMGFGYPMFNRLPNYNYNEMFRQSTQPNVSPTPAMSTLGGLGGYGLYGGFGGGLTPQALAQIQQAQKRAMEIARMQRPSPSPAPTSPKP